MKLLSDLYNVTLKRGIEGAAKGGFVRPTIGENFMTHRDFQEIDSNIGNDAYTKLLLHMDGEDGAKVFTDVSSSNHTVTPTASKAFTFTRPDGPDIGEGWFKTITTGDVSILNNKVRLFNPSTISSVVTARITSTFSLSNDFDIQADFSNLSNPTIPEGSSIETVFAVTSSTATGFSSFRISLYKSSTERIYRVTTQKDDTNHRVSEYITTSATSSKLRIKRVGTTFTGYYWNGTSWIVIGSFLNCWTTGATPNFHIITQNLNLTTSVDFDNFQINSGTLINYPSPVTKIDTKKLGTSSAYFGGDVSYLEIPNSEDFNFGSGDFTIDFWIFPENNNGIFMGQWISLSDITKDSWLLFRDINNNNIGMYVSINNNAYNFRQPISDSKYTLNNWHHMAIVRTNDRLITFFDGLSLGESIINGSIDYRDIDLTIGAWVDNGAVKDFFKGYMDELRISKGIARWTENFTPPTRAYT